MSFWPSDANILLSLVLMNRLPLPWSLKGTHSICFICFIRSHLVLTTCLHINLDRSKEFMRVRKSCNYNFCFFVVCYRCKLAQVNGWGVMVSHRSGETEDTIIADLVVGLCTGQVSSGQTMVDTSISLLL